MISHVARRITLPYACDGHVTRVHVDVLMVFSSCVMLGYDNHENVGEGGM